MSGQFTIRTLTTRNFRRVQTLGACLLALIGCAVPIQAQSANDPVYVFHTTLGDIRVQLYPDVTPNTVTNFLSYVNSGAYNSSFFHRSVSGFVIQGGGYTFVNGQAQTIPTNAPIALEYNLPNTRGTIAMARSSDPNSATTQWFFNEVDNTTKLGPSNGGGYAVFGRIVDSAGLAIMDKIAALPIDNAGSPFDTLPVIDYNGSGNIQASNLVIVTSITPASNWAATSVSVGGDGSTRLLWDKIDGTANLWTINTAGTINSTPVFGPFAGWSVTAIATDRANNTRLLWNNVGGQASLWSVSPNGAASSVPSFGPYSGWAASALSVGTDGRARLAWNNSGQAALWIVNNAGGADFTANYGPYSGWLAQAISTSPDGNTHVLWDKNDGTASLWSVTVPGAVSSVPSFGPYTGWTAKAIASAPDGRTWVLWTNTNGTATLWIVNSSGGVDGSHDFGPYVGWTATSLAVGPEGNARLLWDKVDGSANVWTVTPSFTVTSTPIFGPY